MVTIEFGLVKNLERKKLFPEIQNLKGLRTPNVLIDGSSKFDAQM